MKTLVLNPLIPLAYVDLKYENSILKNTKNKVILYHHDNEDVKHVLK